MPPTTPPASGEQSPAEASSRGRLRRLHSEIEDVMSVAAGSVALGAMLLISVDTFGRYLLDSPITGTYEMVERVLMVLIVWLAVARTLRVGGHVRLNILTQRLPRRVASSLRLVPQLLASGIWFYVAWRGFTRGLDRMDAIVRTTAVPFPQGLPWLIMAVGAAFLALRALTDVALELAGRPTDEELLEETAATDA